MLHEKQILQEMNQNGEEILAWYWALHQIPECAHHEVKTHAYLRAELDKMGASYLTHGDNITIAVVDSSLPGPMVGLRCDTDALPVQEETGCAYPSLHPGVMHACGHDAHMTFGLASAKYLLNHRGEWKGKAKVIFQPAEEGEGGAGIVIRTGLVDDVDVFFSIHVWSPYESGKLHVSTTTVSASVDMFKITIKGSGGHGATPEKCNDAIVAAAQLVTALQSIPARMIAPYDASVLTIGSFHAGTVGNIVAETAELKGTIRGLKDEVSDMILDRMTQMAHAVAGMYNCTAEVVNNHANGVLTNHEKAVRVAYECAEALLDGEPVLPQRSMMIGDDFADYAQIAPICYGQLGIANHEKGTDYPHHNGHFAVDLDTLPMGCAWMAAFTVRAGEQWE